MWLRLRLFILGTLDRRKYHTGGFYITSLLRYYNKAMQKSSQAGITGTLHATYILPYGTF